MPVPSEPVSPRRLRLALLAVFAVTALLHFPPVGNYFDNDDAWNYALEADQLLAGRGSAWVPDGAYLLHQNLLRLTGSLSWVPRYGLFGLWMPAWHLPSILGHALVAALLVLVALRLGVPLAGAVLGGLLFGASPVHPHVIAWIGGTYDIFCAAALLGALLCFIDRRTRWGVALTVLALTSKEPGAVTVAILGLYWLVYERRDGLRAGVRRLAPYLLATVAVLGLRLLQVALRGSVDQAGLPARSLGFDVQALAAVGPTALANGLGRPLLAVWPVDAPLLAALAAGLLLVGLAVRRVHRHPALWFGLGAGLLLLLPVLLLRELGRPMTLPELLFHPRYLYLPLAGAATVVPLAVLGAGRSDAVGRAVAVLLAALALYGGADGVLVLTERDPPARVLADAILTEPPPKGSRVFVLFGQYDESCFRFLMSRWLQERTGAVFHYVLRGSGEVLRRKPERTTGLDFEDFYVERPPAPFDPARLAASDRVYRFHHGGPAGGHALARILPTALRSPLPGPPRALDVHWQSAAGGMSVAQVPEGVQIRLEARLDRPGGYAHRAVVRSQALWLDPAATWGLRLTYTATGLRPQPHDRRFARGRAEVHFAADGVAADDAFVSFRLVPDGQPHVIDLPLGWDPVFRAARSVEWIGLRPLDDAGTFVLRDIALIPAVSPHRAPDG